MTAEEFRARYALLDQVTEGGVRTFHAITPTGSVALVHFVDGGVTPENLALLARLERLQPERRAHVREVTAVDGGITVVTDLLPGFRSLSAWLRGETADSAASPPAGIEPSGAAPAPPEPAETPLPVFAEPPAEPASIGNPSPTDPPTASADLETAAPPAAEATDSAPAVPASVDSPAAPPAFASAASESSRPRAFDFAASESSVPPAFASSGAAPAESVPESSAAPAEPVKEPGEFTKLFQAAKLRPATAAAESSASPAEPVAEPLQAFAAAPPAPPIEPEPVFTAEPEPMTPPAEPAFAAAPEPPAAPAAAPADEPGEFTRLFRAEMLRDALAKAGHGSEAQAPPPPPPLAAAPTPPVVEPPAFEAPPAEPPPFRPAAFESPPAAREFAPPAPVGGETSALFQALSGPAPETAPAQPADLGFARPPQPANLSFARPPEPADLSFELPPPAPRSPGAPADASATSSFAAPFPEPTAGAGDAAPASGTPGGEFSRLFQRLDLPAWAVPPHGRPASPQPAPFPPADPFASQRAAPEPLPFARGAAGKAEDDYLEKLYTPSQSSLGDPDPLPRHDDGGPSSLGMPVPAFSPMTPPSFSTPVPPPSAPAPFPPPPRSQPPAPPPASTTPLVIGIVVVVALALALVLYFVLR